MNLIIFTQGNRHIGSLVDGGGKYKTLIIVSVLTNDVHSPWGTDDQGFLMKLVLKGFRQTVCRANHYLLI